MLRYFPMITMIKKCLAVRQSEQLNVPLVSGLIQEAAEWIFRGQPLKTFEKQAPI